MSIQVGSSLLHYRIAEKLGAGGMGVVWRAVDTTLDRPVAIKVLPAALAGDPDRLARFEREAKLLASLNHPGIAAVYSVHAVEAPDPVRFIAMELVEGEELAARIARGALPVDEALEVARQIALALEAAHERGVVHRDLKPSNVKLTPEGRVKVLDFGLAKAIDDPASSDVAANPALSPTMTSAGTLAGMILGTAAYMSPEQARGKPVDRRADLWAFGCVLFEMLTAKPAFDGETVTDVLSAVISRTPDWSLLPPHTPPSARRLLQRCLTKPLQQRLGDAGAARLEIEDARQEPATAAPATAPGAAGGAKRILPWTVAGLAVVAAILTAVLRPAAPDGAGARGPVSVVAVQTLTDRPGPEAFPALSPDGRNLAYVARDGRDLDIFLQRVGGENAINLTEKYDSDDYAPAFSPDGDRIAFASTREGGGLFVMGATGENPRRVADEGTHPSWSPDGKRLVAAGEQVDDPYSRATDSRIFIVDVADGRTQALDVGEDGVGPRWSPDGKRIAFWSEIGGQRDLKTIAVDGGPAVAVTDDVHTDWEPMWTPDGRALYFHSDRGGSIDLWRIAVDPATGRAAGEPTPVTIGVAPLWESGLSADGTRLAASMRRTTGALLAYDFDPERMQVRGEPRVLLQSSERLNQPDLSRDGRKLAYRTNWPSENITTLDLASGDRRRLTGDGFRNRGPAWSPDGSSLAMYSNRDGNYRVWIMRSDGTDLHLADPRVASDPYWSPDGRLIIAPEDDSGAPSVLVLEPEAERPGEWTESDLEPLHGFTALGWSPDGKKIAVVEYVTSHLGVFDTKTRKVRMAEAGGERMRASGVVSWLADNERIVASDGSRRAYVWNSRTNAVHDVAGVALPGDPLLSPDNRTLYVCHYPADGEIWMLTLGER